MNLHTTKTIYQRKKAQERKFDSEKIQKKPGNVLCPGNKELKEFQTMCQALLDVGKYRLWMLEPTAQTILHEKDQKQNL